MSTFRWGATRFSQDELKEKWLSCLVCLGQGRDKGDHSQYIENK